MSHDNPNTWSLRGFFDAISNMILPSPSWPESELPLIRHRPLADDDDVTHWGDMRYLEALADEIEDRCQQHDYRLADFPSVESHQFWETFDWPTDVGAFLLGEGAA